MKTIPLSNGGQAIVDDANYEVLNQWKWKRHAAGYAYRTVRVKGCRGKMKNLYMHHLILPLVESTEVDHINRIKLDNRLENLRLVPHWKNAHNHEQRTNTKGSRGVTKPRGRNRWNAQIYVNKKRIFLGSFSTQQEAETAYAEATKTYQTN